MQAGIDFPDYFAEDLFKVRRNGNAFKAGNPYDPESLLTGAEVQAGFTYANSRREWPSYSLYELAVAGELPAKDVAIVAPRVFKRDLGNFDAWRKRAERTLTDTETDPYCGEYC